MLFKKIELTNIGPYEGTNTFYFDSNNSKNTILIGGKNGAGKTTLLNSIKLALYGPVAYGLRSHSSAYLDSVKSLLNNKAFREDKINKFQIKIGFTIVEDFERIYVEIIRSWLPSQPTIKENVDIIKEHVHLNDIKRDNFLEKLRTSLPPSLLDLCFFDGEDITNLSDEENLSKYLRELSTKLFNLDLFYNLEHNLSKYLSNNEKTNKEIILEKEKSDIEYVLKRKSHELQSLRDEIKSSTEELHFTKESYKSTRNYFSTHGGLLYEERERIQKEILVIENSRKQTNDYIKEFIAQELPFFLCFPLFKNLVIQLEEEENYYIKSILEEKINNASFNQLEKILDVSLNNEIQQTLRNILLDELTNLDKVPIIHNASKTETHQIKSFFSQINISRLNEIKDLIQSSRDSLNKLSELNSKLKDNKTTSEFNEMIESMEKDSIKITQIEVKLKELVEAEENLCNEIDTTTKQFDKVNNELHNINKKKASYDLTKKALSITSKFQKKQLRKKVKDIEYFATIMINKLLRKKNFIHRIYINHETFKITLIDNDRNTINKKIISAGENELVVLSIIWGTIQASQKELPFVLDTLLGRLDLEHKSSVINKLIPQFSKQVIILATNSEITDDLFDDLIPCLSNLYTLNYDNDNKNTNIENHFFNRKLGRANHHEF